MSKVRLDDMPEMQDLQMWIKRRNRSSRVPHEKSL